MLVGEGVRVSVGGPGRGDTGVAIVHVHGHIDTVTVVTDWFGWAASASSLVHVHRVQQARTEVTSQAGHVIAWIRFLVH